MLILNPKDTENLVELKMLLKNSDCVFSHKITDQAVTISQTKKASGKGKTYFFNYSHPATMLPELKKANYEQN